MTKFVEEKNWVFRCTYWNEKECYSEEIGFFRTLPKARACLLNNKDRLVNKGDILSAQVLSTHQYENDIVYKIEFNDKKSLDN